MSAFEGSKRTCHAQLSAYNARRRTRMAAARAAEASGAPAPLPPARRAASGSSSADTQLSAHAVSGSDLRAALAAPWGPSDASGTAAAASLVDCGEDLLDALLCELEVPPPATAGPAAAALAGSDAPFWWPLAPATAELKIGGDEPAAQPTALPAGLRSAASLALFASTPLAMHAAVAPGCTLLTFDAFVDSAAGDKASGDAPPPPEVDAEAALAALLRAADGVGAYLRARESVSVAAGGRVATARFGAIVEAACAPPHMPPPRLPRLMTLAALAGAAAPLCAAPGQPPLPSADSLRCRVHGRMLATTAGPALAACPEQGVAFIDLAPSSSAAAFGARAPPRPLLLCADVATVGELNAWAAAALATVPPVSAAAWEAAEAAAALLGAALRPNAPAELLAAACGAALALRWRRAAQAPLRALTERGSEALQAQAGPACGALLLAAARSADVAVVRAVLAAGGTACALGAAGAAAPAAGVSGAPTPLHAAAALPSAAAARAACAELTRCDAGAAAGCSAGADAAVAWLYAQDAAGRTPAQLAARHGDAALDAMDAQLRADVAAALPAARAAAAHARERYAACHAPHAADLAAEMLADAAQDADDATVRRAALAGALLRRAAAAAERAEAAAVAADDASHAARRPLTRVRSVLRCALTAAPHDEAEAQWRFRHFRFSIEAVCLFQIIYHIGQVARSSAAPVTHDLAQVTLLPAGFAAPNVPFLRATAWEGYLVLGSRFMVDPLWYQAPTTAALLAALALPRLRGALASNLQPFLALQFAVHALLCTAQMSANAAAALPGAVILYPPRIAVTCTLFTLFVALTWPLRPRYALPLLSVRAALPVVATLAPASRLGRMWPATGVAGARMQVAACCAAAAWALRRERRLRDAYARHKQQAGKRSKQA